MRSNPPFDPRMQPVGIYPNAPIPQGPPIYMQPMMHSPQHPQVNYMPLPHLTQANPSPTYPPIPQHQVQQQYVTTQPVRIPRQQGQGQQPQINQAQQPKPMSVIGNQSSNQSQKMKAQQQIKQQATIHNNNQQQQQQQQQEQEAYEGQQQQQMKNQQIIMFWQHKFYTILERFQLIFQKVQWIRSEFYNLNNQLKAVDSEEEWNQAKQHHEDFMEQLEQFSQELAGVINQNANLLQQQDGQGNQHNVWRQRYFELFQGYKAMQQQLFELKQTGLKPNDPNMKVSEIMANYRQLERQYGQVVNELNQMKQITNKSHDNNSEKAYREKLDFAIKQAQKYKETLDQLHKQNQQLLSAMQQLKSQKNHYEALAMQSNLQKNSNIQHDYQQFHRALGQREQQITMLTKQLKELSQKYNYLVQSYNGMELRLRQQQTQGKNKIKQIEQQVSSKNSQLMQIKVKLHDCELKLKSGNSISEEYQKMLNIRTTQLSNRTNEVQRLRNQLNAAINYRRPEPQRQIGIPRKDHQQKIRKLQQQYEQKIQQLKKRLHKKQQQSQNAALLNIKIESLDKKNRMLLQEIENLNKDLNTKQKQAIQFKRGVNIQQKYKELQYRFNKLAEEKQQINGSLLQKNNQIDRLQGQVNQFQERIKSLSQNTQVHSAKPLIGEIEELNRIIQGKQGQINKLKATISLKQSNIRQLQNELDKTKSTVISNQKLHSRQKDALQESIRVSQRRIQQNQKKMRDLQYEFGSIMKKNLQDEIKNLRSQNQQRQQTIIRLQAEQLELRSRLSHFERIRSTHNGDVDQLSNRIKQLQSSKYDMIKKVQTSFRDVKSKQRQNRQLTDSVRNLQQTIFRLENQLNQNEKLIKEKDRIIDNLQGQLLVTNQRFSFLNSEHENLRNKTRTQAEYLQKQTDDLRRRMFQIQHLNGSRKQLKDKLSTQITKIQNQTIQQLKQQKQFLKSQLATALQQIGHLPNFGSSQRKGTSSKKSKASEGIDYIQKRLFDFNSKLDQIIVKNKQINIRGFGSNIQNGSSSRVNSRQYEQQIKVLKAQIQQLRKYISKLQVQTGNQTIKYNPKNSLIYMEQQKAYNQRMDFYQKQTNQLQARIQNLIRVNTSLKERIDSLLRDGGANTNNFYKTQIALSEETIDNLQGKVTKLLQQNRSLKANSNLATTKICRDYQGKIFDCQNKIFNLERKISSLQLERNRIQNERIVLQRNLNTTQTQLTSTKSTSQKQLKNYQTSNRQLTQQVQSLQSSLADLLEKVRIIQSENNRLTQAVNASYSQQHIILNTPVRDSSNKASTFKR